MLSEIFEIRQLPHEASLVYQRLITKERTFLHQSEVRSPLPVALNATGVDALSEV